MEGIAMMDDRSQMGQWIDRCLVVAYIALMAINFLGDLAGFSRLLKLGSVVVVGIAVLRFLVCFDRDNVRHTVDYFASIAIPVIVVLAMSVMIWLANLYTFADMMAASERLLVQFINIFVAVAAIYLFRGAAMRYTLYAMSIAYGYIVFRVVRRFGIPSFIQSFITFAVSLGGRMTEPMQSLEVHDMTFAFGFFAVYYLTCKKGEPHRLLGIVLSLAGFILGYKRIALLGLPLAVVYNLYLSRVRASEKPRALMRFCWGMFLFCYAYILVTRYGLFTLAMKALGVDTMGRDGLYAFINRYYDVSPAFFGYGFNWVRNFLTSLINAGISDFGATNIHNDIVRQYIEMGFWGYLLWSSFEFVIHPRWLLERHGFEAAKTYVLCTLYIILSYMTDNTMYYYHTAFIYRLVPLVCAQMYHDAADERALKAMKGTTS